MKKIIFFLLSVFLLISCEDYTSKDGTMYIVCCGLDYDKSKVSPLDGTIDDALEVGRCLNLSNTKSKLTYLIDLEDYSSENYPSKENILKTLNNIKQKAGQNDVLVFYYSGHGQIFKFFDCDCQKHNRTMNINETSCSVCGRPMTNVSYETHLITGAVDSSDTFGELPIKELYDTLNSFDCHSAVIIDACYSGQIAHFSDTKEGMLDALDSFMQKKHYSKVVGVSASTDMEESSVSVAERTDGTFQKHSMFTGFFLRELGWQHNYDKYTHTIGSFSYDIYGKLSYKQNSLSLKSVFDRIAQKWTSNKQHPRITPVIFDVNITD